MISTTQLKVVMPRAPMSWLIALAAEMPKWGINTPEREAAFIGQIAHESSELTHLDESRYYTNAERVREMFKGRFDALDVDDAWGYLQQPERFANRIYQNRNGNGDEASGDGWKYRGRGPIQLTGRDNYARYEDITKLPIVSKPEDVANVPVVGCAVACAFWQNNGLNYIADRGDHHAITRKVNGGLFGIDERIHYASEALRVLAA